MTFIVLVKHIIVQSHNNIIKTKLTTGFKRGQAVHEKLLYAKKNDSLYMSVLFFISLKDTFSSMSIANNGCSEKFSVFFVPLKIAGANVQPHSPKLKNNK